MRKTYKRFENQENVGVIMSIHFLATIAQVTRAIATSEPCTFDASHASIADGSCMDEGRKVCCTKCMKDGRRLEKKKPEKKKDNLWGRWS